MSGKATHRGEIHAFRWRYVSITRSCLLIALINILNVPLAQWNPTQGYRFRLPGLPDAGNPERLFIVEAFSGGEGCEPPLLLLECCRSWLTSRLSGKENRCDSRVLR